MTLTIDHIWVIISAFLVFVMQGGFLALETGLTREKNNIDVAAKNVMDFVLSSAMFWVMGFPIMYGLTYFGRLILFPDYVALGTDVTIQFFFQIMFCGTTVTIVSGAIAERTRFYSYGILIVLIAGIVYPIFGSWVWAFTPDGDLTGWLYQMGFRDFAGSTVVHSLGGWAALAMIIIIGARTGRFNENGEPNQIPNSNLPFVTLGVFLLWFGWFGFNGGSTGTFNETTIVVLSNTLIGGTFGGVAAIFISISAYRRVDVLLLLNGILAGLVAVTAGANIFTSPQAALVASVGATIFYFVERLLIRLQYDDVVSAVAVHLGAGAWGTLAVGLFGNLSLIDSGLSRPNQIGIQLLGIVVCGAWTFGIVTIVMRLFGLIIPLRATEEQEYIGLNITEHGARSDLVDLLDVMNEQAITQNMTLRAPVEPFTQIGRIANYYNQVMSGLESAQVDLEKSNEQLAEQVIHLDNANKKLTVANEQVRNFASILSHDLRSPISSVRGLTSEIEYDIKSVTEKINTAKNGQTDEEIKEILETYVPEMLDLITASMKQMDTLTGQILSIAREDGRELKPQWLDTNTIVNDILKVHTLTMREKGIKVEVNDLADIYADPILIQQIFANIISNAIKYLHPERAGHIIISSERTTIETIFHVKDNGMGIPQDKQDRVFQLFRRAGKHEGIEGNGFGLFYIRNLLLQNNGDLWFESTEGIGSTFSFSIGNPLSASADASNTVSTQPNFVS